MDETPEDNARTFNNYHVRKGHKKEPKGKLNCPKAAIWRPNKHIPANARYLYIIISTLAGKQGYCHAKNPYLSELTGINERTIARQLSTLKKHHWISIKGKGPKRRIFPKIKEKSSPEP